MIGTGLVHVYDDGAAYEVEFILASGETVAVLTPHTRSLG